MVSAVHGLTAPGGPASVDRDGNRHLIDAARAAGADVVLLSVLGASADSPMELLRMKYAAEQHLAASGVPSTVVQPTAYLELWIDLLARSARRGGRPVVLGRGRSLVNLVSVVDVAALVDQVVTDPSARGRTLQITGPDNLTMVDLATAVQQAAGRTTPENHSTNRPAPHRGHRRPGRADLGPCPAHLAGHGRRRPPGATQRRTPSVPRRPVHQSHPGAGRHAAQPVKARPEPPSQPDPSGALRLDDREKDEEAAQPGTR